MNWIKVLNSPFKSFRLKFYLGKIAIGVPYFYPRSWVKLNKKEKIEKAKKLMESSALNFKQALKLQERTHKCVAKKWFGIDYLKLGWKTKWSDTDYRFEYAPMLSIIFLKIQFCIFVVVDNPDNYWESWLYYENNTDKSKSKKERLQQCIIDFPQIWKVWENNEKKEINYYDLIIKKKYL